jgi:hypothetical protein
VTAPPAAAAPTAAQLKEKAAQEAEDKRAAARIADVQPAARIIAVLREPASFLRSLHFQFVQVYLEPETNLRKAIGLEDARRQGQHVPSNPYWPGATLYSEHVRYYSGRVNRGRLW